MERVLSAQVRLRNPKTDWNIRAAGVYGLASRLEWTGFDSAAEVRRALVLQPDAYGLADAARAKDETA
jgi:hypothetical protein